MDMYYPELQMNKWRDNCLRQQSERKKRIDKFDSDFANFKYAITELRKDQQVFVTSQDGSMFKTLENEIQMIQIDREPLLISLLSTISEDLGLVHDHLNTFIKADPDMDAVKKAQDFFSSTS